MKKLIKNYPQTKYAAQAAYRLLDNKLCGDWQGLPKCPEKEAELYEKYVQNYPDGPRASEALYNAVYRDAVAVTMYSVEEDKKKADAAAARVQSITEQMKSKYPQSDFTRVL